jgi:hypothetical protein
MNSGSTSKEETVRMAGHPKNNFYDLSFAAFGLMQDQMVNQSFTGASAKKYLYDLLIKPESAYSNKVQEKARLERPRAKHTPHNS